MIWAIAINKELSFTKIGDTVYTKDVFTFNKKNMQKLNPQ